ncbi:fructose-1,6-bisphosphatase [Thermodesulfobium acidiphilum]|uniref:Fructose-1,6-bisphosphatase n=1 Tax=Thermodesulfobium acidiphilum TaxID=1794699 RepID=A0A2R4W044_THEAF|nr:inositol monophosphatase family protein [Thermodesulfobium acidiphilum]AWB10177.1 fructose-1,6-bisphosphatase [Thermodesulfobium acidiphilum]
MQEVLFYNELNIALSLAKDVGSYFDKLFIENPKLALNKVEDIEEKIYLSLKKKFPEYGFHCESMGIVSQSAHENNIYWIVSALSGLEPFIKGYRGACVSIALLSNKELVLGVVNSFNFDDLFYWTKGLDCVYRNEQKTNCNLKSNVILTSYEADKNSRTNSILCYPFKYKCVPSFSYRLALCSVGEGVFAIDCSSPTTFSYAASHALLIGNGLNLYDEMGKEIVYSKQGYSGCGQVCFGGKYEVIRDFIGKNWKSVLYRPLLENILNLNQTEVPKLGRSVKDKELLSKVQGTLIGLVIGDSFGYSNSNEKIIDFTIENQMLEPVNSEIVIILSRVLSKYCLYEPKKVIESYLYWYNSEPVEVSFSESSAFSVLNSLSHIPKNYVSESIDDISNSFLLRVIPIAIFTLNFSFEEAFDIVETDCKITNPNSLCLECAKIFLYSIRLALKRKLSKEDLYKYIVRFVSESDFSDNVKNALIDAKIRVHSDHNKNSENVLVCIQNLFYEVLNSNTFEESIIKTSIRGGDTSKNCALVGSLFGALYGLENIPIYFKDKILSSRSVKGLPKVAYPRPQVFWPVDILIIAENLLKC